MENCFQHHDYHLWWEPARSDENNVFILRSGWSLSEWRNIPLYRGRSDDCDGLSRPRQLCRDGEERVCTGRSGWCLEKTIWILPFVWTAGGEYGSYFVDGSDCLSSNTASDEEREGERKGIGEGRKSGDRNNNDYEGKRNSVMTPPRRPFPITWNERNVHHC